MSSNLFTTIKISNLHDALMTLSNKLLSTSIIKIMHLMIYFYILIPCIKKFSYNSSHNHKGIIYSLPHQIVCPPLNYRTLNDMV